MARLIELVGTAIVLILSSLLVYGLVLWGAMLRNVRHTSLPVFTVQNFQESWLTALVVLGLAAFAGWGAYMYDKAGKD